MKEISTEHPRQLKKGTCFGPARKTPEVLASYQTLPKNTRQHCGIFGLPESGDIVLERYFKRKFTVFLLLATNRVALTML